MHGTLNIKYLFQMFKVSSFYADMLAKPHVLNACTYCIKNLPVFVVYMGLVL